MNKEEFYFDSRDAQTKLHAVRYTPDDGEVRCVVQIVHGMAEYVERYEEFAKFLTDRHCAVTGEDHLGHGKSVGPEGTYGYFCAQDAATVVVRDVHRLKKMTQAAYPDAPYFILGHSMGSFILRNYLCRYGSGITGAVVMGTGMQPGALVAASKALAAVIGVFAGPKKVSRFLDRAAFGQFNKKIPNPRTKSDWLTKETDRVDAYIADPLCGFIFTVNGFSTLAELISRIQKLENLEKIPKTLPVFMVSGSDDPVGEYGEGVRRAMRSMEEAGVKGIKLKLYEGDRHELLNETDREQVMKDVYDWMQSVL